jgi:hypothetical protein
LDSTGLENLFGADLQFLSREENSYVGSLDDLDPWCDRVTTVETAGSPQLKVKRLGRRRYARQFTNKHLRRGKNSIVAMNFRGKARKGVKRVRHKPKEVCQYLNYRADKCGDTYLWGVLRTRMGTNTLCIINAAYATNFLQCHSLLGDFVDLRTAQEESLEIHTIYICEPAMSHDLFNGANVAMVAYGDEMFLVVASTVFPGFIKKLTNLAAMVQLGPRFGWLPSHCAVVRMLNNLVVKVTGTGGAGKSEFARLLEEALTFSKPGCDDDVVSLSDEHRHAARLIVDDLALTRLRPDGTEELMEMELGHYLRGDHPEMLKLLLHWLFVYEGDEPVVVDNFEIIDDGEGQQGINLDKMVTLDGVPHDNGRAIARTTCYEQGTYELTGPENTVVVDVMVSIQLAPPTHDPDTGEELPVQFVPPPMAVVNPQQLLASMFLSARIGTQSIRDPGADPLDIVIEGIGTLPPFLIVPDHGLVEQHMAHFGGLDPSKTACVTVWNRNGGGWCCGKYGNEMWLKAQLTKHGKRALRPTRRYPGIWTGWAVDDCGETSPICLKTPDHELNCIDYDDMVIDALSAAEESGPNCEDHLVAFRLLDEKDVPSSPNRAIRPGKAVT